MISQKLKSCIKELIVLISEKKYNKIQERKQLGRLTIDGLSLAIEDYKKTIIPLPNSEFEAIDIYEIENSKDRCFIDVSLWTREEGRSDLTLSLYIVKKDNEYSIEINDIHVL